MRYAQANTSWRQRTGNGYRGGAAVRPLRPERGVSVQTLKSAVAPIDFYLRELPAMPTPKRDRGWVDGGLCPFHDDRNKGNFRVNLDSGGFICFSCQSKGGDILSFACQRYSLSFRQALESLANEWGVRA